MPTLGALAAADGPQPGITDAAAAVGFVGTVGYAVFDSGLADVWINSQIPPVTSSPLYEAFSATTAGTYSSYWSNYQIQTKSDSATKTKEKERTSS